MAVAGFDGRFKENLEILNGIDYSFQTKFIIDLNKT